MKKHKHKWYETNLIDPEQKKYRKSFACKCGCWKVETNPIQEIELKKFSIKNN